MDLDRLTEQIIGAAIEVHRNLGPGLLESAYRKCLCHELGLRGIPYSSEIPLPVVYKGEKIDCGYRYDVLVADTALLELKAVQELHPVYEAQLLTYMRLGGWKVGYLINFNVKRLIDGLKRYVIGLKEDE